MKKIIGLVGPGGAGKGAAGAYLREKYGAGYHRFSEIIQRLTDQIYLEPSRDNLIRMSEAVRHEFGEDILARTMAHDVERDAAEIVCVDGIRRLADIEFLLPLSNFILVHLTADPEIRWQRIRMRKEKPDDANKTLEQFQADEQRSTEVSIAAVAAQARVQIVNNGTKEELFAQLEKLLQ